MASPDSLVETRPDGPVHADHRLGGQASTGQLAVDMLEVLGGQIGERDAS